MKTQSPTVSKIQIAGSGMRPMSGLTERSHPNTSPMTRAPPLAVRVSGSPAIVIERRPTSPPSTMPVPTKIISVVFVGQSGYPSSLAARSTSGLGPTRLMTSPRSIVISGTTGISSPARTSFCKKTPRATSWRANSATVCPASVLFVTTTSNISTGMSSNAWSSTSGPILAPCSTSTARRVATAMTSSSRITVLGCGSTIWP